MGSQYRPIESPYSFLEDTCWNISVYQKRKRKEIQQNGCLFSDSFSFFMMKFLWWKCGENKDNLETKKEIKTYRHSGTNLGVLHTEFSNPGSATCLSGDPRFIESLLQASVSPAEK